jgi:REP element-mobilizing transposase RayT
MFPDRKNIRRSDFDYGWCAAYFVTICTYEKRCVYGRIDDSRVRLNQFGRVAHDRWLAIPEHHPHVQLDAFIVMPNHVHGILLFVDEAPQTTVDGTRAFGRVAPGSLSTVIRSYKGGVTSRIRAMLGRKAPVWQPKFYDRIVRIENDLDDIRQYILNNPARWTERFTYETFTPIIPEITPPPPPANSRQTGHSASRTSR